MYEYDDDGLLVRAVATTEPEWTDADRGLLIALLAERRDICPQCGHPMSQCRDPATAGSWTVVTDICQPGRVAQAVAAEVSESKRRGVVIGTRRT